MKTFGSNNIIMHITSAPYFPAAKRAAKNSGSTVKQFLIKEYSENTLVYINKCLCKYLLHYRTSPHYTTRVTLIQLVFIGNIETKFDLVKPKYEINKFRALQ